MIRTFICLLLFQWSVAQAGEEHFLKDVELDRSPESEAGRRNREQCLPWLSRPQVREFRLA